MKKRIVAIILAVFLLCSCSIFVASADSGWDYSYDSGGSSDWSSSGSSDWSSDGIGVIVAIGMVLFAIIRASIGLANDLAKIKRNEQIVLTNLLTKYPNFNIEKFREEAFNIYKSIQVAWSEFDYDTLRKLTTDEMYNMYKMQLETLSIKNEKNIMKDFSKMSIYITNFSEVNGVLTINVKLDVRQKDYVINSFSNKVIRGSTGICSVLYDLTFVNNLTNEVLENCPNCGAPISNSSSQKCEYCNSDLVNNSKNNWVLAKKQIGSWEIGG